MTPPTPVAAMRSVADVLDAAADLIEPQGAWTQGVFAREHPNGRMTWTMNPAAKCFCLRGALVRVGAVDIHAERSAATEALGFKTAQAMTKWNDSSRRTQAEVVFRLRKAASLSRASEGNGEA